VLRLAAEWEEVLWLAAEWVGEVWEAAVRVARWVAVTPLQDPKVEALLGALLLLLVAVGG
jgi:hypothetical protein